MSFFETFKTVQQRCAAAGVSEPTYRKRKKAGLSEEECLKAKPKPLQAYADECGLLVETLRSRIIRGLPMDLALTMTREEVRLWIHEQKALGGIKSFKTALSRGAFLNGEFNLIKNHLSRRGIKESDFYYRLTQRGMEPKEALSWVYQEKQQREERKQRDNTWHLQGGIFKNGARVQEETSELSTIWRDNQMINYLESCLEEIDQGGTPRVVKSVSRRGYSYSRLGNS